MTKFSLNDANAFTKSLKGLKKPAILLLGFLGFCCTLTKLDDETDIDGENTDSSVSNEETDSYIE